MKAQFKIKKVHLILTTLLVLNILAYFTISSFNRQIKSEISGTEVRSESETYIQSGVKVLSWSYNMIQYFRHKGSENT